MALRPEDPSAGFQHGNVVAFINEKMARHIKGPEFYLENISLSWAEVEDKLRAILENSAVTSEAKEACAWGSLALGVRCARRQGQLHACRVQWLQDFTKLHKSALQALASNMKEVTEKHEMECKEAAYQLQLTLAKLAEVQKEKELEMVSSWEWQQVSEEPGLATTSVFGAEGAGEEKTRQRLLFLPLLLTAAVEGGRQKVEASCSFVEQKTYTYGRQRQGHLRSVETAMLYFGTLKPRSTVSQATLPVQLPASFTYPFIPPIPFPEAQIPSPPWAAFAAGAPSQAAYWGPSMEGAQGRDPQEPQRDQRAFEPQQLRRPPASHRPGDWNCSWCNPVNFSGREICYHCGRGTWLQNP
uniref:RanBP2-type domain-containing protein n=1 Tax=Myotis lucifugus TaxID=59463 RepID=G1QD62_MYOLU